MEKQKPKKNKELEDSFLGDMKKDSPLIPHLNGEVQMKIVPYGPIAHIVKGDNREKEIRKNLVSGFMLIATVLLIIIMLA